MEWPVLSCDFMGQFIPNPTKKDERVFIATCCASPTVRQITQEGGGDEGKSVYEAGESGKPMRGSVRSPVITYKDKASEDTD